MVSAGLSAQLMNSDGQFVKRIDRQQDVIMVSMANEKHSQCVGLVCRFLAGTQKLGAVSNMLGFCCGSNHMGQA